MNCYRARTKNITKNCALTVKTGAVFMNTMSNETDNDMQHPTFSHVFVTVLKKAVSSLVVFSYLSLTMGQSYAMDRNKVAPFKEDYSSAATTTGLLDPTYSHEHIAQSGGLDADLEMGGGKSNSAFSTPVRQKLFKNAVAPIEEGSPNSVACVDTLDSGKKKVILTEDGSPSTNSDSDLLGEPSDEVQSEIKAEEENVNEESIASVVENANVDPLLSDVDAFEAYTKKLFWGNKHPEVKKNYYINTILTTMIVGALAYSIKAEGKVASYTVFRALATTPYFYEEFYYNNLDNGYYYENLFILGLTISAAVFLTPFIIDQSSEFIGKMRPSAEETILKERYGYYIEKLVGGVVVLSALSAGFMIASQFFVAAYGIIDTPQFSKEDITTLPVFLGLSYAMAAYNMKSDAMGNQLKDFHRYAYGDVTSTGKPVDVKRERLVKAIESYQKEIKEMPERSKSSKVGMIGDIENQLPKTVTVNDVVEKLQMLEGVDILKEITKGKLVRERNKQHRLSAIEQLRSQHVALEQESTVYKFFNETRKAVLKNKWLVIGGVFAVAPAVLSYLGFVESTQITLSRKFDDISKIDTQKQLLLQYEILEKYKDYNAHDPYGWLEQCIGVNNIHVISNVTYELTDDYFYNTSLYDTTTYKLIFTSPNCPGVLPIVTWIANGNADMAINDYNAIGENSWFSFYEGSFSYQAGIPTVENNYTAAEIPEITISPIGQTVAKVGAGFYAAGIYGLSTLGMAETLEQLSYFDVSGHSLAVGSLSFIQGVIRSAPLGVATWLSTNAMDNQTLMYLTISMTGLASILMYLPGFKKVYNKCLRVFSGKDIREDVIEKIDSLKGVVVSMKPDAIDNLYSEFLLKA